MEHLAASMAQSLTTIAAVQRVLKTHAQMLQARAVANVSGNSVTFQGKTFIINRQTGKLARSIQIADAGPLALRVVASAEYAGDVELGTRGPVDLKHTKLAGKIVPMPVGNKQGKAWAANPANAPSNFKANTVMATTGKKMGMKYIRFMRVPGPGGKGWIIPKREGRPFMAEAADYVLPLLTQAVQTAFADYLSGS
jgi:hypothetical protein